MEKEKLFKKFKDKIKSLEGKTFIIYHFDVDGFCSAVITWHSLELLGIKPLLTPSVPGIPVMTRKLKKFIQMKNPRNVIFVDMPIDEEPKNLVGMQENIIILDHHLIHRDLNSENVLHINTNFFTKTYYPASKLVYDLFSQVVDIKDLDWVAAVGIIADNGGNSWKGFLNEIYKKYPDLKKGEIYDFDCPIGEIGKAVNSARILLKRGGASKILRKLFYLKSPQEALNSDFFKLKYKVAQKRIESLMNRFERNAKKENDFWHYYTTSGEVKSNVATILSQKYPDKTIMIYSKDIKNNYYLFTLRRHDKKVDLPSAIKKSIKDLKGSRGGGHITAAGGFIKKDGWRVFFERIRKLLIEK